MLVALVFGLALAHDMTGGFEYGGLPRTYLLHIPPADNDQDSLPLVLNLHWGGGSPVEQATFSAMNPKADSEGFFVVYPAGTIVPFGWRGWNSSACIDTEVDDVGFISALIETLKANYKIDTLRIYATGFCNGGMMVQKLACELSSTIAAFATVAGGLTEDNWATCTPDRLIPLIHFHARNDPSVPYNGGWYYDCHWPPVDSFMNHWVMVNSCDPRPDSFYNDKGALRQRWSRTDDSCEIILWTTDDGSHYWPGSSQGTKDISANAEMWDFFVAHPMPIPEVAIGENPMPMIALDPGNPNIFRDNIQIRFSLREPEHLCLEVYDLLGSKVLTAVNRVLAAGEHNVFLNSADLASGVYFYRLGTPSFSQTRMFTILK